MPAVDVGRGERVAGRNSATCTAKGEQTRNSLEVIMRNDPTFELNPGLVECWTRTTVGLMNFKGPVFPECKQASIRAEAIWKD